MNIAYYVHHHGSGHLMRALTIGKEIKHAKVTLFGSDLQRYMHLIPAHIAVVHLPMDIPTTEEEVNFHLPEHDNFHYAPINVKGIRQRNKVLLDFFYKNHPVVLIVDVSVEITLFARLCAIPTLIIKQHGKRDDTAHRAAYQSTELLIAPYPASMDTFEEDWFKQKTYYAGGFSRYTGIPQTAEFVMHPKGVAVILGAGGSSLDHLFVFHLAKLCADFQFHVIGNLSGSGLPGPEPNLTLHGNVQDPMEILLSCTLVIGNAGHNTVMEMADLSKKFICIPEERPFGEQREKASYLQSLGYATVVLPDQLYNTDWHALLIKVSKQPEVSWEGVIHQDAVKNIVERIQDVTRKIYGN